MAIVIGAISAMARLASPSSSTLLSAARHEAVTADTPAINIPSSWGHSDISASIGHPLHAAEFAVFAGNLSAGLKQVT
jgi:hypothetical protein